MTRRLAKARIRQSFERAAPTYDSAADVQRRICRVLAEKLPARPVDRMLDAGCGTGFALPLLQARFPTAQAIALDLSAGMLARVETPCWRLAGDLEHLPLADASLDLYWTSLAVQWCELSATLHEARRVLKAAGHLALASLGPDTFHELRTAFAGVDEYRHTLGFQTPEDIARMAREAGFTTVDGQQGREIAYYPDFRSLLRAVKAVGANQVGDGQRPGLMSRQAFAQAEARHETLRKPAGLPLTYDVIYLHAQP